MIKHFTKPFNVVYRTRASIYKKIESIEYQIEFEKYKSQNKDRLIKLERELEYYQMIIELKDDDTYIDGVLGGEIMGQYNAIGALVLGTVIGLGIRSLKK